MFCDTSAPPGCGINSFCSAFATQDAGSLFCDTLATPGCGITVFCDTSATPGCGIAVFCDTFAAPGCGITVSGDTSAIPGCRITVLCGIFATPGSGMAVYPGICNTRLQNRIENGKKSHSVLISKPFSMSNIRHNVSLLHGLWSLVARWRGRVPAIVCLSLSLSLCF